jgi:hypothetical protein
MNNLFQLVAFVFFTSSFFVNAQASIQRICEQKVMPDNVYIRKANNEWGTDGVDAVYEVCYQKDNARRTIVGNIVISSEYVRLFPSRAFTFASNICHQGNLPIGAYSANTNKTLKVWRGQNGKLFVRESYHCFAIGFNSVVEAARWGLPDFSPLPPRN